MSKVKTDEQGRLILPDPFLKRRHISSTTEYWLDEREGDLILHPRLPDVRKLYIQPTTVCNLHCRTCIRNVWDAPEAQMSAERRCRFVQDRAIVVGQDGGVSPCYALSHNYTYFAVDGRNKRVNRYVLGSVNEQPLAEIWMSEEYVRFRSEVREFHFPSCPDCDLRDGCDLRGRNEGCWGWNPSCADCLWAQDIVRCP
jgi:MoaA/NifB/PqqE/SkfB family radical SAM enzyme